MEGFKYKQQADSDAPWSVSVPSEAPIELPGEMLEAQELPTTK